MNDSENIGYLIKKVSDKMAARADMSLEKHGLTFSQIRVMEFLEMQGGRAAQQDIAKHLGASHPTVVGIVSRLEAKSFVTSFISQEGRHNKIVCVTDKWIDTYLAMKRDREISENMLTKGLNMGERLELILLLEHLNDNLSQENTD